MTAEQFGAEGGSYDIPPKRAQTASSAIPKPIAPPPERAKVTILKGMLHQAADDALNIVSALRPPLIHTWGEMLADVIHVPDAVRPQECAPQPRVHVLDEHAIAELFNRHVEFQKLVVGKTGEPEPTPVDCPAQLVRWVRGRAQWRGVLPLAGLREAPTLLPSGRLISKPGYDLPSGLLLNFNAGLFPAIPTLPTKDQAVAALKLIDELLVGFPFCADHDRAALHASIISGAARSAFQLAPFFLSSAPVQSSGKSTAAALPSLVATGREPMSISPGDSDEEADKRILAALMSGRSFMSLDNLLGEFELASVARAISEPTYGGRVLGLSRTIDLPTTAALWTGSGNNVIPRGDLVSRTVPINLDPQDARPWLQKRSNRSPRLVAVERRPEFLTAALTIVMAYIAAGYPDVGLGGFRLEEWATHVRAPLVWIGDADPLEGMRKAEERDPAMELLRELMLAWGDRFGSLPTTVSDAVEASVSHTALLIVLRSVSRSAMQIESRRVGRYLASYEGRIVDERKFVRNGTHGAAVRWQLVAADEVCEVREVSPLSSRGKEEGHSHIRGENASSHTSQTDQDIEDEGVAL